MACEVRNSKGRVCIAGEMNIYSAPLLKESLLAALRINLGAAAIDLSQVTEMDTTGLQLLLLARRLSIACGSELKILSPSDPAREVLELCGLDKLIAVAAAEPELEPKRANRKSKRTRSVA